MEDWKEKFINIGHEWWKIEKHIYKINIRDHKQRMKNECG